ncbi:uncharacterized protein L203_101827 [Cryptococcus depauperatus CBS 7841]|uniref:DUF1682-domain-containing protein n=1 Tax=Cryptococcus depauperatus CBS 7841 TaxID=1295531 RepID=A0AAJ8JQM8_9TREE
MSAILKILGAISPPPPAPLSRDYEGYQVCWKMLCFRPSVFKFEAIAFALVGLYLGLYFVGRTVNQQRAKSTIAPFRLFFSTQFASIQPLLSSSPALHLLFATGRRSVLALHATIILYPLHDLPSLIISFVRGIIEPTYQNGEKIEWDLTLGSGSDGLQEGVGVWGLVAKDGMKELKAKRWDLTFAKLTENAIIPITHTLFQEHSDVTELVLKTPNIGVNEVIKDSTAASVLKYLLITDVAAVRPAKGPLTAKSKSRHIILGVNKPSNNAEREAVEAWLQVAFNLADLLARPGLLKPDVARKLQKTRATVDADLLAAYKKEEDELNPAEQTSEDKRLAKKKEQRAKLSEKELKKVEELDRKRELRKLQKKGMLK